MLVQGRLAIVVVALAVAIPFGAFEYRIYHVRQIPTNSPQAGGRTTSERFGDEAAAQTGRKTNDVGQSASLDKWKSAIEETLKKAEGTPPAREEVVTRAEVGDAPAKWKDLGMRQEGTPAIDLSNIVEAKKQQPEAGNEIKGTSETTLTSEAKETDPSAGGKVNDGQDAGSRNDAYAATLSGPPLEKPSQRIGGKWGDSGHRKRRHYVSPFNEFVRVVRTFL